MLTLRAVRWGAPRGHGHSTGSGRRAVAVLVAALGLLSTALAPDLRAQEAEAERWRVVVDLGFNGASGNSSFAVLNTGFEVTHLQRDLAEFELGFQYRYGESEGDVIARNVQSSLKLDLNPNGVWSPFIFATAGRDRLRRLDLRSSGGAGAKYVLWRGEAGEASLSAAALYSYESYFLTSTSAAPPTERTARWSWRFKGKRELGETVVVENVSFYQPVWDHASDYYVDVTSTAAVQMWEGIQLRVQHQYQHEETPPEDVVSDDNALTVGLRFVF